MRPIIWTCGFLFAFGSGVLSAQREESKTSHYVKIKATAGPIDRDGRQAVSISVHIDKDYILLGNKVYEDLAHSRFRVLFTSNGKPVEAEVTYPAGKVEKDGDFGEYTVYENDLTITAVLRRVRGDASPVEIAVRMQGFPAHRRY